MNQIRMEEFRIHKSSNKSSSIFSFFIIYLDLGFLFILSLDVLYFLSFSGCSYPPLVSYSLFYFGIFSYTTYSFFYGLTSTSSDSPPKSQHISSVAPPFLLSFFDFD
jgi:hypothetical protein